MASPGPERRRAERVPVDLEGELFLSEGRRVPVRIVNLGELGALLSVTDLEEAILEGERAVLGHPALGGEAAKGALSHTAGKVMRVELEFDEDGVSRHLALHFDGGAPPHGHAAP